jgi:hypothetical protein
VVHNVQNHRAQSAPGPLAATDLQQLVGGQLDGTAAPTAPELPRERDSEATLNMMLDLDRVATM